MKQVVRKSGRYGHRQNINNAMNGYYFLNCDNRTIVTIAEGVSSFKDTHRNTYK